MKDPPPDEDAPLVELALALVRTTSMLLVGKWAAGGALRQ